MIPFNSINHVLEKKKSSANNAAYQIQTYGYLYISKTNISNVPSKNMTAKTVSPQPLKHLCKPQSSITITMSKCKVGSKTSTHSHPLQSCSNTSFNKANEERKERR